MAPEASTFVTATADDAEDCDEVSALTAGHGKESPPRRGRPELLAIGDASAALEAPTVGGHAAAGVRLNAASGPRGQAISGQLSALPAAQEVGVAVSRRGSVASASSAVLAVEAPAAPRRLSIRPAGEPALRSAAGASACRASAKSLFLHADPNYYQGLPFAPCVFWFKSIAERLKLGPVSRALSALKVPLTETLCLTPWTNFLLLPDKSGLQCYVGADAKSKFVALFPEWSKSACLPDGSPVPLIVEKVLGGAGVVANRVRVIPVDQAPDAFKSGFESECVVFQRFVPPKSSASISVLRVAWRAGMSPCGFRLKDQGSSSVADKENDVVAYRWIVSSDRPGTHAYELKTVPVDAATTAERVAAFSQTLFKVRLSQLVVDLVQAHDGSYKLLQVKAFTVDPRCYKDLKEHGAPPLSPSGFGGSTHGQSRRMGKADGDVRRWMRSGTCSMCACHLAVVHLAHRMTPKMMVETAHHLRKRGISLFRLEGLLASPLAPAVAVCDVCWALYSSVAKLHNAERQLAHAMCVDGVSSIADESTAPFVGALSITQSSRISAKSASGIHGWRTLHQFEDGATTAYQTVSPGASPLAGGQSCIRSRVSLLDMSVASTENPLSVQKRYLLRRCESSGGCPTSPGTRAMLDRVPGRDTSPFKPPRRGGEAVQGPRGNHEQPCEPSVSANVVQWRMLIYLSRVLALPCLGAEADGASRLRVRLRLPWRKTPLDFPLVPSKGRPDGSVCSVGLFRSTLHYFFTEPGADFPMHGVLSVSKIKVSILSGRSGTPGKCSAATQGEELYEGSFTLKRMLESLGGFLGESCVMLSSTSDRTAVPAIRLTLGLVCDDLVPSEYVVLRRFEGAWISKGPYSSSHALPHSWVTSLIADRASNNAGVSNKEWPRALGLGPGAHGPGPLGPDPRPGIKRPGARDLGPDARAHDTGKAPLDTVAAQAPQRLVQAVSVASPRCS